MIIVTGFNCFLFFFYTLCSFYVLEKMSTCYNNPEKSSATKINKQGPSAYSFFTNCSFYLTKNKLDWYRYKDCIETFCKDLKEHATKSTNYGIKEMMSLFDKENKSHKK